MNIPDFCSRLKALRKSQHLTQEDFSEIIGLCRSTYTNYEHGHGMPPIDVVVRIAEYFNVSLDWLCGLSQQEQRYVQ